MGLNFDNDEYVFKFRAEEERFREIERARLNVQNRTAIGINTGCSPTIPYKKFSVKGWVELIALLARKFPNAKFLMLGGPEDTARNAEIAALWRLRRNDGSIDLALETLIETPTTTGLRRGMVYVDLCDVVVTGDSLGMHMAIALKKQTVAWFGPTCAHEIDFYGRGEAVVTKAQCSPCWKRSCDKTSMCYDQVSWLEMASAVQRALNRIGRATRVQNDRRSLDLILSP
jgi:heptosyltransferase II